MGFAIGNTSITLAFEGGNSERETSESRVTLKGNTADRSYLQRSYRITENLWIEKASSEFHPFYVLSLFRF
ncbi:hypothetical protein L596_028011 [Steinernema carpocapsae]|uniref:Uncharacterized protein n=1 Tax=Steinernema carpocapsae TaxID=34508 RepID=A0A4U5LX64_STECR|nr:hypothetical protein L596_028011 [Steinernema carpocapsae]